MLKKLIISFFLLSFLILSSCRSDKSMQGLWMLSSRKGEIPTNFKTPSDTAEMVLAGSFLNIESNGDFNARIYNKYIEGEWKITNDSMLQLTTNQNNTLEFKFRHAEPDSLLIHLISIGNTLSSTDFTIGATLNTLVYKEEESPYVRENNLWAVKPDKKQTSIEIRKKILNYIYYLRLVLNDPYNNSEYINHINNPITLANNGLSLRYMESVDEWYKQTFFDEDDFKQGYRMLDGAFRCHLDVMDTDNVIQLDNDLLTQIHDIIKEVKERK